MIPIRRDPIDIFLQPGDFYFGDAGTRIRTVLGSCVAITLWHPVLRVGGMCHYMLPERGPGRAMARDGCYAEDAMLMFLEELRRCGTRPAEYRAKLFGGGRMFADMGTEGLPDIGEKNIAAGRLLLEQYGFTVMCEHAAGPGHRNLIFEIHSGDVWVKHVPQAGGCDTKVA